MTFNEGRWEVCPFQLRALVRRDRLYARRHIECLWIIQKILSQSSIDIYWSCIFPAGYLISPRTYDLCLLRIGLFHWAFLVAKFSVNKNTAICVIYLLDAEHFNSTGKQLLLSPFFQMDFLKNIQLENSGFHPAWVWSFLNFSAVS